MYEFKLEKFAGPLDLLLQLIEEQKLDITEVSLGIVTEQYLNYVNSSPHIAPEELADFLVIATKLILIKSRLLLPTLDVEDEGPSLADQLKMYKEYVEATKLIEKIIKKKHFVYLHDRMPISVPAFRPPKGLTAAKIGEVFTRILRAIAPVAELPKRLMMKAISIGEKMEQIKKIIFERTQSGFHHLLRNAKNKTEIIVSFLALLELIKQRTITVSQKNLFEDIEIQKL